MAPVEPVEVELKLAVASADLSALQRRLGRFGQAARSQVESIYYDTDDRLLASRGLALRLRRSDDRWIQTLKCESRAAALSHRGEWEMPARIAGGRARVDLARFADTPLARLLAEHPGARLEEVFRTKFERATWTVELRDARIVLALDLGEIVAGARREPVREIELELKSGPAAALPALALRLVDGGGMRALALIPYSESKSARGYRLASGTLRKPTKANAREFVDGLDADSNVETALRAFIARGTEILIANAHGALAEDEPEFVHQARVALRRMRSALRLLRRRVEFPARLADESRWIARVLGELRDWDVLIGQTLPEFAMAIEQRNANSSSELLARAQRKRDRARAEARAAFASARFARLALGLLAWASQASRQDGPTLRTLAPKVLQRQRERLFDAAQSFGDASPKEQHRVRILAKRLRYALDLCSVALPRRAVADYTKRLAALQDDLGAINDVAVASLRMAGLTRSLKLRAEWRSWSTRSRMVHGAEVSRHLSRLDELGSPWR